MRYILLFGLLLQSILVFADRNCGTESLHQIKLKNDPTLINKELEIENFTRKFVEKNASLKLALADEIIIPVVFHVVYYSAAQNISDTRLREQIEVLNNDFNALNFDISKVPGPFQSLIGKFKIKFVLANRDPQGNVTSGVDRVKTTKSAAFNYATDDVKFTATAGVNAWDTKSYLNIWVCNISDYSDNSELLGYATFPTSAGQKDDGVVLNYKYVGVTGATRPFNLGRTATHEIGHYFNLRHIWGDQNNCTADDGISDTPKQFQSSSGDPRYPKTDNCTTVSPGIMFMNFMDYCNDASLYMFTLNQASRMDATMAGPRASLVKSRGYVNATEYDVAVNKITAPSSNFLCDNTFTPSVNVVSNGNNQVTSFKVDFSVNKTLQQTATWTGSIGLNGFVNVIFNPITIENGTYNIAYRVYNTNGIDTDPTNDTISKSLKVGTDSKSLPLTESFETSIISNGFSISNTDDGLTWARSTINSSTDGNYSIFMNNHDYDPLNYSGEYGVSDDIIFPFINLSDYDQATMSFDLSACQFTSLSTPDNNWDSLQVLVSTDCGQTFKVIYNKYAASLITVPNSANFFKPSNPSQWRTETIDLSQYAGRDNVLLKFRNISQFENNIYIDKLNINGNKVTSIKDAISDVNIQMYPNPTKGEVVIKIENKIRPLKQIQWINTLGQVIQVPTRSPISNYMQFDFTHQAKGIYIANFIFEDGTISSKKLILN
jgi:hypothetical protein